MAIDFNKVNLSATAKADKPKADLWLNIGYEVEVETSEGKEKRFINLPFGTPLDTMEPVPTNSSNEVFAAMQAAKNDLLAQLIAAGKNLKPGEEQLVNLQIQLRRVSAPSDIVTHPGNNPFIKKLAL